MLGKLYISVNTKTERLQNTTELVLEAIDGNVAQDAPSRNALKKLLSVLNKALGDEKVKPIAVDSSEPAGGDDGLTAADEQMVEGSVMANDEGFKMDGDGNEGIAEVQESVSEEFLDVQQDNL